MITAANEHFLNFMVILFCVKKKLVNFIIINYLTKKSYEKIYFTNYHTVHAIKFCRM